MAEQNNDVFEFHLAEVSMSLFKSDVDFVDENVIPESVCFSVVLRVIESSFLQVGLDPSFQNEELHDGGIGDLLIEVSIIKTVSSVSESESTRI